MKAVAIDGPAGAGKSTIAKQAAERLGYIYVDTGALYRAIGLYVSQRGADPAGEEEVAPLLKDIRLELVLTEEGQRVLLNGEDVSRRIRTPEAALNASRVAALPAVRAFLLELQRGIAERSPVVMDGRDIGTVVLPEAEVKIFLTAAPEERARRRLLEHQQRGEQADYQTLLEEIKARDRADSTRAIAPLRQAEDAVLLDTTHLTPEEAIQAVLNLVKRGG